ncbi:MAG: hypothetical protein HYR94_08495 [Chloroflexi bacterium]|nr:hypothetical protein [Chloroflexota bacterium]
MNPKRWIFRRIYKNPYISFTAPLTMAKPGSFSDEDYPIIPDILIAREAWPTQRQEVIRLTLTPPNGETRLQEREAELQILAGQVEMLLADQTSWLREEKGKWVLTSLKGEDRPERAQVLEEAVAQRLPRLDITDLLIEIAHWTNFSRHLKHASTGSSSQNEQELTYLSAAYWLRGVTLVWPK